MRITKRQLRRIIKEEKNKQLLKEQASGEEALQIIDDIVTRLEDKMYQRYDELQVENFAVEAAAVVGNLEPLLIKLMNGEYGDEVDDF